MAISRRLNEALIPFTAVAALLRWRVNKFVFPDGDSFISTRRINQLLFVSTQLEIKSIAEADRSRKRKERIA